MLHALLVVAALGQVAAANVKPQIGYVYPPAARPGSTIEVRIGGYDWTPDMEVHVHDPRVKLEFTGPAGDAILSPPPYWFGQKAGQAQPPLPREVPAKLTIPAGFTGPLKWQVANANGASNVNTIWVDDAVQIVEPLRSRDPITLPSLPATVSGRLNKITELDRYRFTTPRAGLITCRLDDRAGAPFNGKLTITDAKGSLLVDDADTIGRGAEVRFLAEAGATYEAGVQDVDFAGDPNYVYRLSITTGPTLVTAAPLVLGRGEKRQVEFIGWGIATGALRLESLTREVQAPADAKLASFEYQLKLADSAPTIRLQLDAKSDTLEPKSTDAAARQLTAPAALTGRFEQMDAASQMAVDRYRFSAKKGDALRIQVEAESFASPVDPTLAIVAVADGKEIIRNDDLPTSVDAAVDFKAPDDGEYELIVSDLSGTELSPAHLYRLSIENPEEAFDFTLVVPDKLDLPLGGQADLILKPKRRGAWDEDIEIKFAGLPPGVELPAVAPPPPMPMPGVKKPRVKKPAPGDMKLTLTAAADAPATAALATIIATATVDDRKIERRFGPILVATTLKTRCKVKSAVQDGGRIVNRGTTYPADVIIERLEGYEGPVTLEMAAQQQRQRRGIRGGTMQVAAGVDQVQYPVYMPEWLETSLTARINVIGVVQVPDPKGKVRHVTGIMDGLIVMSLEGALMKVSHESAERTAALGGTIDIPVKVSRGPRLKAAAKLEVVPDDDFPALATAEIVNLPANESAAVVRVQIGKETGLVGLQSIKIRATALQDGKWPAISETSVPVLIAEPGKVAAK